MWISATMESLSKVTTDLAVLVMVDSFYGRFGGPTSRKRHEKWGPRFRCRSISLDSNYFWATSFRFKSKNSFISLPWPAAKVQSSV